MRRLAATVALLVTATQPGSSQGQSKDKYPVGGIIGEKYKALNGSDGPLGRPTNQEMDAKEGRKGRIQTFEHGSIGWTPDTGPKSVQALYVKDHEIIFEWGDTGPFNYDYFVVRYDLNGKNVGQDDIKNGPRTHGRWSLKPRAGGRYRVVVEGRDNKLGGGDSKQGWSNPLYVDFAAPPDWHLVDPAYPPFEEPISTEEILAGFYETTPPFVEAKNEGRLMRPLRAAAAHHGDVEITLKVAAAAYALARASKVNAPGAPLPTGDLDKITDSQMLQGGLALLPKGGDVAPWRTSLGNAFADLAVSGKHAAASYRKNPPKEPAVIAGATKLLQGVNGVGADDIAHGAAQALSRANQVNAYLTALVPDPRKRKELHWIAASAEDDQPHRPVNIPSLPYPQYNIAVPMKGLDGKLNYLDTRYSIISNNPNPTAKPHISPNDVVLLFIHGDSSRLEEVQPLIKPLFEAGARHGRSYTIVALDLPSHGCTDMISPTNPTFFAKFDWDNHAPRPPGRPANYPILEFIEHFIVNFVGALDHETGVAKQLVGPMGGSLGGNLSLRLSRRTEPWIRQSVAWSPASVWNSLADDLAKQAGPNHCSTEGHKPEKDETRAQFFQDQLDSSTNIGPINLIQPQGQYWYRNDWPGKPLMLINGRKERHEIYTPFYRQWHYRMDWEQLIYSYNDPDKGSRDPRYKSIHSRLLLASGKEDDNVGAHIYSAAITLAGEIANSTNTGGRTFFIDHTGHSIHDERPKLWAEQIDCFTTETLHGSHVLLNAGGKPLYRFTGDKHDWSGPITVNKTDAGKMVLQLLLTVTTGDDDLRAGSNARDNADVSIKLHSGQTITIANINRGKRWGNQETHSVQLFIPANRHIKAEELASLSLHTRFGGGFDGDNWNVDRLILSAVLSEK
jgi:pimeloyl-ACP methyl ester carboxylesterase